MKRSKYLSLVLIGSVSAMATLSGCGSPQPVLPPDNGGTFANMAECLQHYDQNTCATADRLAKQSHWANAPHYNTLADCIAQYGPNMCQSGSYYGGGNNVFVPMMLGYMMGSASSRPAPLYYGPGAYHHFSDPGYRAPIYTSGSGFSHQQPIGAAPYVSTRGALNSSTAMSTRGGFGSTFKPAPSFTQSYATANPTAFGKTTVSPTSPVARSFTSTSGSASASRSTVGTSATSNSARGGFGSMGRSYGGSSSFSSGSFGG